eukprot:CAMPEP_0184655426 /NCGR_PEP_ID=MMETSP0308-20130426/13029_1 /TAXON_ID=38269 /ORGANISM="Gloeochaete witrockiana, Strain SAG 46.84" /LENGTH=169 /DNA_ID=CAMNT_0027091879 /DNA_START=93 /DNA_END=602 /DNA_ORIENTATION=+
MAFITASPVFSSRTSSFSGVRVEKQAICSQNKPIRQFVSASAEETTEDASSSRRQFLAAGAAVFASTLLSGKAFAYSQADPLVAGLGGDLERIDLNNVNIRVFQHLPGLYPTIGKKIQTNGPYKSVSDVYNIGLSEEEKERFKKYESKFFVNEVNSAIIYDRVNNGIYK